MDEVTQAINHFSVLMEGQNAKLDAVLEYVSEVPKMARKLDRVEQKVDKLERDMQVVKAAVTATNSDLKKHKSLPAHLAHGHA
jgi:DNA repair ATPase RecN